MEPIAVLAIQVPWNLLVYTLMARWWIVPRLARRPLEEALPPLLAVHFIRPISFWTTVGERIPGMTIPRDWAMSTAVGDLVSAVLALVAILALRARSRAGLPLVWVANVVGFLDALKNGVGGARTHLADHVGPAGILMAYAVPALFVSHGVLTWLLVARPRVVA